MKWEETVASNCRYGECAGKIFGNMEIICEYSRDDYQGYAEVLAVDERHRFYYYEWYYGSCSGCDDWERRDLSDRKIVKEMWRGTAVLENSVEALRFFEGVEHEQAWNDDFVPFIWHLRYWLKLNPTD